MRVVTADQLNGGENLVLGEVHCPIREVKWNIKRQGWVLTYEYDGNVRHLLCKPEDQIRVHP